MVGTELVSMRDRRGGCRHSLQNNNAFKGVNEVNKFSRLLTGIALSLVASQALAGALDDDFSETLMVNLVVSNVSTPAYQAPEYQFTEYQIPDLPLPALHVSDAGLGSSACVFRDAVDLTASAKTDTVDEDDAAANVTSCTSNSCKLICSRQALVTI